MDWDIVDDRYLLLVIYVVCSPLMMIGADVRNWEILGGWLVRLEKLSSWL